MTDRAQFEAMLEALINEDQETAKEIFHNIVVAKSREIYEELLAEDFGQEEEESMEEGEGEEEEGEEEEGEEEEEDGTEDDADGEEDDAAGEEDDFGSEEDDFGGDEGLEDRVMDLEDALEDLKAEFEQLLAGEEAEEHDHPGIHDVGGDDMDDMGGDLDSELEADEEMMPMMEYKNLVKVAPAKMGDDGVNNKSAVASKNDMGGTAGNIAQSFSTTSGGTKGGLAAPTAKDLNSGNINTVPGKAGKAFTTRVSTGHGAEKKGSGEKADNKKSTISTKVR